MLSSKTDFLELRDSDIPTKNNSIPEDIEQLLSGKCFQFGNEIGRFSECQTPNHSTGKTLNPIPSHHPKNSFF
jgi:hypothetical protein